MAQKTLSNLLQGFQKSGLIRRILVTGGCGDFGRDLYPHLKNVYGTDNVLITDIQNKVNVPENNFKHVDVKNRASVEEAVKSFKPDTIIHLASLSPTECEENPALAIKTNAEGSRNVIEVATTNTLRIFAASSIASFGPLSERRNVPDLAVQRPETMQGITKFYLELMGNYHRKRYNTDFRALRYPIIVSPTVGQGKFMSGVAEMYHAALTKGSYTTYIRPNKLLPAIYVDDAIFALLKLLEAPKENLKENTFNVSGCSFTPQSQADSIKKHIKEFNLSYKEDGRSAFFESWPETLNDSLAREQWGYEPHFGLDQITGTMLSEMKKQL